MVTKSSVLEQNKESILKRYREKESMQKIADTYNCNAGLIYSKIDKWIGIKKAGKIGTTNRNKDEILDLFDNHNYTMNMIAKKFEIRVSSVHCFLKKHNRDTSKFKDINENGPLIQYKDLILQQHLEGKSSRLIALQLGYSEVAVWKLLDKLGYDQSLKVFDVDESFFEKIDTSEKAYVLGLLYGDGTISKKRGTIRIALQEKDKEILEKVKAVLKYEGPLHYIKPKNERCQAQYGLDITRTKMVDDLIQLGCMPAKSNILKFPTEDQVPKTLIYHFLRGIGDADGSISNRRGTTLAVSLTSSFDFCEGFENFLKSEGIECKQYFRKDKEFTSQVQITKHNECLKYLEKLYENATIYMKRKHDKFIDCINNRKEKGFPDRIQN